MLLKKGGKICTQLKGFDNADPKDVEESSCTGGFVSSAWYDVRV